MTKVNKKTFINIFKVFYIRKFFCHLTSPVSCLEMIECLTGIESSVSDPSRREIPCIVWRIEIDKTTPQTQEECMVLLFLLTEDRLFFHGKGRVDDDKVTLHRDLPSAKICRGHNQAIYQN